MILDSDERIGSSVRDLAGDYPDKIIPRSDVARLILAIVEGGTQGIPPDELVTEFVKQRRARSETDQNDG